MNVAYTTSFKRSYQRLKENQQARIDAALRKFMTAPHHPFPKGLRVHKLGGVTGTPSSPGETPPPVWEMHATGAIIITFQYGDGEIIFRNCGEHDAVLRSP